jgi:mannose-6-phosphate isomerase-like protein (cupin superfamily)
MLTTRPFDTARELWSRGVHRAVRTHHHSRPVWWFLAGWLVTWGRIGCVASVGVVDMDRPRGLGSRGSLRAVGACVAGVVDRLAGLVCRDPVRSLQSRTGRPQPAAPVGPTRRGLAGRSASLLVRCVVLARTARRVPPSLRSRPTIPGVRLAARGSFLPARFVAFLRSATHRSPFRAKVNLVSTPALSAFSVAPLAGFRVPALGAACAVARHRAARVLGDSRAGHGPAVRAGREKRLKAGRSLRAGRRKTHSVRLPSPASLLAGRGAPRSRWPPDGRPCTARQDAARCWLIARPKARVARAQWGAREGASDARSRDWSGSSLEKAAMLQHRGSGA